MGDLMKYLISFTIIIFLYGCSDPNKEPKYGKDFGLPENCRAYVQAALDNYENKVKDHKYSTIDTLYYCEPNKWYSEDCHQHLADVQFSQDIKDEQTRILIDSLQRNCGKYGELWGKP